MSSSWYPRSFGVSQCPMLRHLGQRKPFPANNRHRNMYSTSSTTQLYPDVLLHHRSLGQLLRHYYDSENTQNGNPKQSTAATMDIATGQPHSQHHRYGWIPAPCQQKVQPQHRQCPGPDSLEQRKSTGILARLVLISQARAFSATVNHSSLR